MILKRLLTKATCCLMLSGAVVSARQINPKEAKLAKEWTKTRIKDINYHDNFIRQYMGELKTAHNIRHDVLNLKQCRPMTVIWARDTTMMWDGANLDVPAGPFLAELAYIVGKHNLSVEGVSLDRQAVHRLLSDKSVQPKTGAVMAGLVVQAGKQCPNTTIVMAGTGIGSEIARMAAEQLSDRWMNRVQAFVTFGDPAFAMPVHGLPVQRVLSFCVKDDFSCLNGYRMHRKLFVFNGNRYYRGKDYVRFAKQAAAWVMVRSNLLHPSSDLDPFVI